MNHTAPPPNSITIQFPQGIPGTAQAPALPEFVRLPRTGEREPFTGMSLSTIRRLMVAGRVETKVLKTNPAATRGCVLIRLRSLIAAIEGDVNAATTSEQPLPPAA